MDNARIADSLTTGLGLDMAPVALAFLDTPPDGVAIFDGRVPSSCSLWRRAESGVFYAPAATHLNCALGSMVMGFDLPQHTQADLQGQVEMMLGAGYITGEEPARVPRVPKTSQGILYGPLRDFPVAPDLILTWVTPAQAMLYAEADGDIQWASSSPLRVLGRPGCTALPMAMLESKPSVTFGCAGMRTYTGIGGDRMLMALPASRGEVLVDHLGTTDRGNDVMLAYYREAKSHYDS